VLPIRRLVGSSLRDTACRRPSVSDGRPPAGAPCDAERRPTAASQTATAHQPDPG